MSAAEMIPVGRLQVATPRSMALAIRNTTEAQQAVDERIAPVAVEIITSTPTVLAAAAEAATDAVETEVAGRDLIAGADPRVPLEMDGLPDIAQADVDRLGNIAWSAADTSGGPTEFGQAVIRDAVGAEEFDVPAGERAAGTTVDAKGLRSWTEYDTVTGGPTAHSLELMQDALGPVSPRARIRSAGDPGRQLVTLRDGAFVPWVPDPRRIVIYGESHMLGLNGGVTEEQTWSSVLAGLLPAGSTVTNLARGGSIADEAAFRAGAWALDFDIAGSTIPTSGSVTLTLRTPIRTSTSGPDISFAGALVTASGNIAGAIANNPATPNIWTFTRSGNGAMVEAATGRFVSSAADTHADATLIIGSAVNDSIGVSGLSVRQRIDRVVTATCAIVESQRTAVKNVLVLGSLTRSSDTRAGNGLQYQLVTGAHAELDRIYPSMSFAEAKRQWVNQRLIRVLGITPTPADETAMYEDTLPPSVTTGDNQHLSAAAQAEFANYVLSLLQNGFLS